MMTSLYGLLLILGLSAVRFTAGVDVYLLECKVMGKEKCYLVMDDLKDFDGAMKGCLRVNAKLAAVETYAELTSLNKELQKSVPREGERSDRYFRVAGKKQSRNDISFVWVTSAGKVLMNDDAKMWSEGEPNNLHSREDCLTVDMYTGKFNDLRCHTKHPYICEF